MHVYFMLLYGYFFDSNLLYMYRNLELLEKNLNLQTFTNGMLVVKTIASIAILFLTLDTRVYV